MLAGDPAWFWDIIKKQDHELHKVYIQVVKDEIRGHETDDSMLTFTWYPGLGGRSEVYTLANNIYPEESFDKTYTAYQTFDASRLLTDVQDELCAVMIQEIAENIYNDTVAKW